MKNTSDNLTDFLSKFSFRPEMAGFFGTEREHFLISSSDRSYAPKSKKFLETIRNNMWTYELSACQVESRTQPQIDLKAIEAGLLANKNMGDKVAIKLGLELLNQEVADVNMPLDVYPDQRYLEIAEHISEEQLRAACQVAGTHIHIGANNIDQAITINNLLVPNLNTLCDMGDHSNGARLRLYRTMAKNWQPTIYQNPEHLFEISQKENFTDNPRNCWKLIRISIHGTVELRMFGATNDINEILGWISFVKSVLKKVM